MSAVDDMLAFAAIRHGDTRAAIADLAAIRRDLDDARLIARAWSNGLLRASYVDGQFFRMPTGEHQWEYLADDGTGLPVLTAKSREALTAALAKPVQDAAAAHPG